MNRTSWISDGLGAAAVLGVLRSGPCRASPGLFLGVVRRFWGAGPRRDPAAVRRRGQFLRCPKRPAFARRLFGGGSQAYCVRTCDGRYFPIAASDSQSRAASCSSFCPASETKVVYGSNIDNAATENGKPYSELPNAFRYRNELVAGCTCNGKDQSASRRSKSRTIRRFAKVTSSPAPTA